jgi:hypothetical protein
MGATKSKRTAEISAASIDPPSVNRRATAHFVAKGHLYMVSEKYSVSEFNVSPH